MRCIPVVRKKKSLAYENASAHSRIKKKHRPEGSTGTITCGNLLGLFSFIDHSAARPTSNKYLLANRTMTTNK
jgi:hypothetical protein